MQQNKLHYIYGAYDSHIHLLGTGLKLKTLDLSVLKTPQDLASLNIKNFHFRGDVLFGFGWNDNLWQKNLWQDCANNTWDHTACLHSKILDKYFSNYPVFFVSVDGHRAWLNTLALKKFQCQSNGLLHDTFKAVAQKQLQAYSKVQIQEAIQSAQNTLNASGFTHIRDLSGKAQYWDVLINMDLSLSVRIEQNMEAENPNDFLQAFNLAIQAKKENLINIKVRGVKVYYDGSLGGNTALLSQGYLDCDKIKNKAKALIDFKDLKEMIKQSWMSDLDFSIHSIGDKATEDILNIAEALIKEFKNKNRSIKKLNLEHVQLLSPSSLDCLARNKNIICHMQPCHFLSDKLWLNTKLNQNTLNKLFKWRRLEEQKQELYFGSDSPVEPSSLFLSQIAIEQAKQWNIDAITKPYRHYHTHPDKNWVGKSYSLIDETDRKILEVCFNGKIIIKN